MKSKLARASEWIHYTFTQGVHFHGGRLRQTAMAWADTGLTVAEAKDYIAAGVFDALACKEAFDIGVGPDDLKIRTEDGVNLG